MIVRSLMRLVASLACSWTLLGAPPDGLAKDVSSVPPLPQPTGSVIRVSTEQQLQAAVRSLRSGTTVLIAPGTYRLTASLVVGNRTLRNVVIRGATNRRDDVVLVGTGMSTPGDGSVPFGIWVGGGVEDIQIANLTIRDFYFHSIILNAGTRSPHVYNVRLVDSGQQLLKANPTSPDEGIPSGLVEYSVFEYSTTERDDYPKAIDVHGGTDWIIRHNLFRRIRAPEGQLSGPAILVWRGSRNVTIEGNSFIDCQREIMVGGEEWTPNGHEGGVIRNNFIYRTPGMRGDAGISVWDSPRTQVLHNTVLLSGTYTNAIEYRYLDTVGVTIANNLTDAVIASRDGATATLSNNFTSALPSFFVGPAQGNLHLAGTAAAVIDMGTPANTADVDWDGDRRPQGAAPDIGADEANGSR